MTSYLRWLDYSAVESKRMMDVIAMFTESDARDNLGLGPIRDEFADHLFPETGTVQTRALYFFYVPSIYRSLDIRGVSGRGCTGWSS